MFGSDRARFVFPHGFLEIDPAFGHNNIMPDLVVGDIDSLKEAVTDGKHGSAPSCGRIEFGWQGGGSIYPVTIEHFPQFNKCDLLIHLLRFVLFGNAGPDENDIETSVAGHLQKPGQSHHRVKRPAPGYP